jgi:hypothetical protein
MKYDKCSKCSICISLQSFDAKSHFLNKLTNDRLSSSKARNCSCIIRFSLHHNRSSSYTLFYVHTCFWMPDSLSLSLSLSIYLSHTLPLYLYLSFFHQGWYTGSNIFSFLLSLCSHCFFKWAWWVFIFSIVKITAWCKFLSPHTLAGIRTHDQLFLTAHNAARAYLSLGSSVCCH